MVFLFQLASCIVTRIPESVGRVFFAFLGTLVAYLMPKKMAVLEANQKIVCPHMSRRQARKLRAQAMRSYFRYYYECFRLPVLSPAQIQARVRVVGIEKTREVLAHGPATAALFHAGNWDLAGAWAHRHLAPVTTIAEKLEPRELFDYFVKLREGVGIHIYPLEHGVLHQVEADMYQARSQSRLLFTPLLADRDLSHQGIDVELCGEKARVAPGPALLAQRNSCPLIPVFCSYERLKGKRKRAAGSSWGIVLNLETPLYPQADSSSHPRDQKADLERLSQEWVNALEAHLRAHVEDWHMLQKVFVRHLDPERLAKSREKNTALWQARMKEYEQSHPNMHEGEEA